MAEERRIHESWKPVIDAHREMPVSEERREALHGAVKERIEQARNVVVKAPVDDAQVPTATEEEHETFSTMEQPEQVAYLGKIALEDGIDKAVRLAQRTGSEYVVDALHDMLVDELSQALAKETI